ncbi:cytochrome-c oxidase, cbb3-type subunit III [Paracoccus marinaquae]|uniref:Cbb3-type cytochrome c oxidase subunit n=1 Tax=Paracoccus marinaquae TaxID=2841926 RepID=A0ABS6AJ24_9RHOB|nr:cytochrome-c oxidase, cbb3-type subunit III [Paracoccus marinaquae]MBU3030599.1 cytochrome-c oxidase, cbb3-type subunit III [Paracoccus marinaquae]
MSDHHQREIDPVTGYDTTGHEWNGIKELNTPFPRIAIWALLITVVYAVIAWILLPAWPLGRDYTRGLLGLNQGDMAVAGYRDISDWRGEWLAKMETGDFEVLRADADLMATAMPAAERLFADNCAACHGETGQGGPGFPVLSDAHWLWGADPEAIAETIRFGINSGHPDARIAEMPAFDWMSREERAAVARYVSGLPEGRDGAGVAADLFAENCASCHGDGGEGGLEIGAPSLRDAAVIYGQDSRTVQETLRGGRAGTMPAWTDRLSEAEIRLLTLYVAGLAEAGGEGAE